MINEIFDQTAKTCDIEKFLEYVKLSKNDEVIKKSLVDFLAKKSIRKIKISLIAELIEKDFRSSEISEDLIEYIFTTFVVLKPDEQKIKIKINERLLFCYVQYSSLDLLKYLLDRNIIQITNFYEVIMEIKDIEEFKSFIKVSKVVLDYKIILSNSYLTRLLASKDEHIRYFLEDKNFINLITTKINIQYNYLVEKIYCVWLSPILLERFSSYIRTNKIVSGIKHGNYIYGNDHVKFSLAFSELKKRKFNINNIVDRCYFGCNLTLLGYLVRRNKHEIVKLLLENFKDKIDVEK